MNAFFGNKITIVPQDRQGRTYLLLTISFVSFIYLWQVVRSDFFVGKLNILLGTFFWLCPAFCLIPFFVYLVGLCNYVFRLHGHISPVLFLVGGFLLAGFLPAPPTPEEILFSWQKAKYEQIVELARNNQLQQSDNCRGQNQFSPPSGYFQWSNECIYVEEQNGIVVEFAPQSLERPIVYLEHPTGDIFASSICENVSGRRDIVEGLVFKQINEHWFICKRLLDS